MRCFLCKKNNFEQIYTLETKKILRCRNDGLFLADATASHKNNVYKADYFDNPPHPQNSNRSYFLKKLEIIKLITDNRKPKTLDIGCGWGDFEEILEQQKIPYLGIDINREAIEICKKKGLNCHQESLNQLLNYKKQFTRNKKISKSKKTNSKNFNKLRFENWNLFGKLGDCPPAGEAGNLEFDCITMFQLIEHLKNPIPMLKVAKKLLKKKGVVLITTPNNDSPLRKIFRTRWSVYNEPSHFVFYNNKSLEQTLNSAEFNNVRVSLDSWRFLTSKYILNRLIQIYPSSIFNLLTSNFQHLTFNIPTDPFGDLVTIALSS